MASRRTRPEDWAPMPQTRIHIRAPREEALRFAQTNRIHGKPPRPLPINFAAGEVPVHITRDSLESPRAPEIVDFAAPSTWPRRAPPPHHHVAYQQRSRPPAPSPSSMYSSRQSEMSFGILDYYAREPSPPPTPKVDLDVLGSLPPKIGTPVVDAGLGKFDFGLGLRSSGLMRMKGWCWRRSRRRSLRWKWMVSRMFRRACLM